MSRIQCVRDLDPQSTGVPQFPRTPRDALLQRRAVQKLHGDEGLPVLLANVVDGANVGMIQGGGGLGFAPEALQSLRILGHFIGQELEGYEAAELGVLGFVDDTHASAPELFDDAVVRDILVDHGRPRRTPGVAILGARRRGVKYSAWRAPKPMSASALHWQLAADRLVLMRVRVLFFGVLKELTGKAGDSLDLPEGASVRDVLAHYGAQTPRMKETLASLAVAVNQQYAGAETRLKSGDEIALLPPVSGGSEAAEEAQRRAAIVRDRIDTPGVLARLKRGEDGAAVVFEGVVRNQTRGRRTLYLDYEAYEAMALQQMEPLAAQALRQFQIRDVALVHRLGRLQLARPAC